MNVKIFSHLGYKVPLIAYMVLNTVSKCIDEFFFQYHGSRRWTWHFAKILWRTFWEDQMLERGTLDLPVLLKAFIHSKLSFWRVENLEKVTPSTVDLGESETQLNNLQVRDLYTGSENLSPIKWQSIIKTKRGLLINFRLLYLRDVYLIVIFNPCLVIMPRIGQSLCMWVAWHKVCKQSAIQLFHSYVMSVT